MADAWDPSKDGACEAYGAAGLMRMPGRLHITWEDDNTLKIETDAGQQTRLLHFGAARPPAGERTLQGYSVAEWGRRGAGAGLAASADLAARSRRRTRRASRAGPAAGRSRAPPAAAARWSAGLCRTGAGSRRRGAAGVEEAPQRWAPLKVVTTQLRPGWLRKNGVPYSENTVITEHFIRFSDEGDEWFTVVTTVEDPTYLTQSFITSTNFKREADGAKFKPTPCRAS